MKSIKLLIALILPLAIAAQTPKIYGPEQDCVNAIAVTDTNQQINIVNEYYGAGQIANEIDSSKSCLKGENNSVWFKVCISQSGTLAFNVIPNGSSDNYDWAVYNLTNSSCYYIKYVDSLEVSCNSIASTFPSAATGPNGGTNSQDEPVINVLAGELYYILVNREDGVGFTIDFSQSTAEFGTGCLTSVVENPAKIEATLYPNPSNQNITLKLGSLKPTEGYMLAIYNSAGTLVKEQTNTKTQALIDISTLATGLYTYKIVTTKGKTAAGRFVKE